MFIKRESTECLSDNEVKTIVFRGKETKTWFPSNFPLDYSSSKLYFCEFCLEWTPSEKTMQTHTRRCKLRGPIGNEIYSSDNLSVFKIHGGTNQEYCRRLCLLSMLFLKCKVIYNNVKPFIFYVLTKNDTAGCHFVGYFSKSTNEEDRLINLSCLMTLPQYQKEGYGRFLIDMSYLISKRDNAIGTPERPFTGLGLKCYESYWKSTIIDYLAARRDYPRFKISDIERDTGILCSDINDTLKLLNFYNCRKDSVKMNDSRWAIVDGYRAKLHDLQRIPLRPERLRTSDFCVPILKLLQLQASEAAAGKVSRKRSRESAFSEEDDYSSPASYEDDAGEAHVTDSGNENDRLPMNRISKLKVEQIRDNSPIRGFKSSYVRIKIPKYASADGSRIEHVNDRDIHLKWTVEKKQREPFKLIFDPVND